MPLFPRNLKLRKALIHYNLVDNGLDYGVDFGTLAIVGGAYMVYTIVADKVVEQRALTLLLRVVNGDRVATEILDQLHTGNIRCTIAKIYHTREWYGALRLLHKAVDIFGVEYRLYALVDFEDKLCLVGVIDCYSGPVGYAIDIVEE